MIIKCVLCRIYLCLRSCYYADVAYFTPCLEMIVLFWGFAKTLNVCALNTCDLDKPYNGQFPFTIISVKSHQLVLDNRKSCWYYILPLLLAIVTLMWWERERERERERICCISNCLVLQNFLYCTFFTSSVMHFQVQEKYVEMHDVKNKKMILVFSCTPIAHYRSNQSFLCK